jgi:uncharacterized 2Fe-2S/4Fe-4S cluster protein (DUF4445 family)
MEIYLPSPESSFEIVQHYAWEHPPHCDRDAENGYGMAIDIGTTTLAFALFDLADGTKRGAYSMVNGQRAFGADVITRILKAAQGAGDALHTYIVSDIRRGVAHILSLTGVPPDAVVRAVIAGNTTMLHLLHGMPCESLGVYPFTPVIIGSQSKGFAEMFGTGAPLLPRCEVLTLPGISTFVGADITAGMLCLGGTGGDEAHLLIDLGTNGEMALFCRGRVWVASTAAGPAFEAGNISQGMGSVEGAITSVQFAPKLDSFSCTTIGNVPPSGICGTGVVDITAALATHGLMDETGLLDTRFEKNIPIAPGIAFTQRDIREMQLAKAAVRAGIEIVLAEAGFAPGDISRVSLAGGFGHRIRPESAEALGLFPPGLAKKARAVGNTSLGGAAMVLLSKKAEKEIEGIAAQATEVSLSGHPKFNELFMEHMLFPRRCQNV